jgi:CO/xanthine dehydrogenase FAD-binding subunit
MIIEYHRPTSMEEALNLLNRSDVLTLPMGGGTILNQPSQSPMAVVDLQALGLNQVERRGNYLVLGATATLQTCMDWPELPTAVAAVIRHEATYNLRQVATLAGTLVSAGGRSPFTTAMLALDASLQLQGAADKVDIQLGDFLPVRKERLRGRLITSISIPVQARLAYEVIARTPADLPIVCVVLAQWPSGRTRVALGGYGNAPLLAMDGPEASGASTAAGAAYSQAGDEWASAAYRQEMAAILTQRCLEALGSFTVA